MPSDQFRKDVNLDYLNPDFLSRLMDLLVEAKLQGYIYKVYSGYRPFAEQAQLYKLYVGGGNKAAPPGLSAHNYGLAVDCGRLMPDGKVSWLDADLAPLADLCQKHKLDWGGHFGDKPHIGMLNYVTGSQLQELAKVYGAAQGSDLEKLKAVWQCLKL